MSVKQKIYEEIVLLTSICEENIYNIEYNINM